VVCNEKVPSVRLSEADELRDALGTPEFEWIAIPESGSTKLNFHYHALIAGLPESCGAAERLDYMRRWQKRAGDAHIVNYKPDVGGIRYVVKSIGPEDTDKLELHLRSYIGTNVKFAAK
jgi:hypothetical protein